MASILDIVKGLNQAASNAYDGYKNMDDEIGLRREEGHPILDSRIVDGFRVRFSADKMIVTYQSDVSMKEVHPRNQFENEIEARFGDILKFLKKEYKKVTKESVSLTEIGETDMLVQSTSRVRNWVQATKQYKIGGIDGVDSLGQTSDEKLESNIKKFMELHTTKKANKAPKNPDTPKT
jgi:hypothetical protein|tara:strand:+ start:1300 stop:1836 length:537 start_codon:yes stop_codon:yes gene_type:complete